MRSPAGALALAKMSSKEPQPAAARRRAARRGGSGGWRSCAQPRDDALGAFAHALRRGEVAGQRLEDAAGLVIGTAADGDQGLRLRAEARQGLPSPSAARCARKLRRIAAVEAVHDRQQGGEVAVERVGLVVGGDLVPQRLGAGGVARFRLQRRARSRARVR